MTDEELAGLRSRAIAVLAQGRGTGPGGELTDEDQAGLADAATATLAAAGLTQDEIDTVFSGVMALSDGYADGFRDGLRSVTAPGLTECEGYHEGFRDGVQYGTAQALLDSADSPS